ncbi:putative Calmodulin-binding protein CRAG [Blattamonas nauphoetae]|uniref:Calmodulin-binding protein CRAG n=1 Tax=Blattamonas nauphoetae TaxID=2049346 RepID=A0ABQ9X2M6_9EUKA|nr:putative Calmodulin-binding protein CRAG [Blattamonas nauphoetae]
MTESQRLAHYYAVCGLDFEFPSLLSQKRVISSFNDYAFSPTVLERFPHFNFSDLPFPTNPGIFCFPSGIRLSTSSNEPLFFSNTLTDIDGNRAYLFCLQISRPVTVTQLQALQPLLKHPLPSNSTFYLPTALILMTKFPLYNFFHAYMEELYSFVIAQSTISSSANDMKTRKLDPSLILFSHIKNIIFECPGPRQGISSLRVAVGEKVLHCFVPGPNDLPLLDFDLSLLFYCLSPANILTTLRGILFERHILFVSSRVGLLGIIPHLFLSLLHPFEWPHTFIPILPSTLITVVEAPTPFIVGIDRSIVVEATISPAVIVVDLDTNSVELPREDEWGLDLVPEIPKHWREKLLRLVSSEGALFSPLHPAIKDLTKIDTTRSKKLQTGKRKISLWDYISRSPPFSKSFTSLKSPFIHPFPDSNSVVPFSLFYSSLSHLYLKPSPHSLSTALLPFGFLAKKRVILPLTHAIQGRTASAQNSRRVVSQPAISTPQQLLPPPSYHANDNSTKAQSAPLPKLFFNSGFEDYANSPGAEQLSTVFHSSCTPPSPSITPPDSSFHTVEIRLAFLNMFVSVLSSLPSHINPFQPVPGTEVNTADGSLFFKGTEMLDGMTKKGGQGTEHIEIKHFVEGLIQTQLFSLFVEGWAAGRSRQYLPSELAKFEGRVKNLLTRIELVKDEHLLLDDSIRAKKNRRLFKTKTNNTQFLDLVEFSVGCCFVCPPPLLSGSGLVDFTDLDLGEDLTSESNPNKEETAFTRAQKLLSGVFVSSESLSTSQNDACLPPLPPSSTLFTYSPILLPSLFNKKGLVYSGTNENGRMTLHFRLALPTFFSSSPSSSAFSQSFPQYDSLSNPTDVGLWQKRVLEEAHREIKSGANLSGCLEGVFVELHHGKDVVAEDERRKKEKKDAEKRQAAQPAPSVNTNPPTSHQPQQDFTSFLQPPTAELQQYVEELVKRHPLPVLAASQVTVSKTFRMQQARRHFWSTREVTIRLQAQQRMKQQRKYYLQLRSSTIFVQSIARMRKHRRAFLKMRSAAIQIQSIVRMWEARQAYIKTRNGVILIQSIWRMKMARKQYLTFKNGMVRLGAVWKALLVRRVLVGWWKDSEFESIGRRMETMWDVMRVGEIEQIQMVGQVKQAVAVITEKNEKKKEIKQAQVLDSSHSFQFLSSFTTLLSASPMSVTDWRVNGVEVSRVEWRGTLRLNRMLREEVGRWEQQIGWSVENNKVSHVLPQPPPLPLLCTVSKRYRRSLPPASSTELRVQAAEPPNKQLLERLRTEKVLKEVGDEREKRKKKNEGERKRIFEMIRKDEKAKQETLFSQFGFGVKEKKKKERMWKILFEGDEWGRFEKKMNHYEDIHHSVFCLRTIVEAQTDAQQKIVATFSFRTGGEARFNYTYPTTSPTFLFLMPTAVHTSFRSSLDKEPGLCFTIVSAYDSHRLCSSAMLESSGSAALVSKTWGKQNVVLIDCFKPNTTFKANIAFVNPNENHLPLSEIPLPISFIVFAVIWTIALVASIVVTTVISSLNRSITLHLFFILSAILCLLSTVTAIILYHLPSYLENRLSVPYILLFVFPRAVAAAAVFVMYLIASHGTSILHHSILYSPRSVVQIRRRIQRVQKLEREQDRQTHQQEAEIQPITNPNDIDGNDLFQPTLRRTNSSSSLSSDDSTPDHLHEEPPVSKRICSNFRCLGTILSFLILIGLPMMSLVQIVPLFVFRILFGALMLYITNRMTTSNKESLNNFGNDWRRIMMRRLLEEPARNPNEPNPRLAAILNDPTVPVPYRPPRTQNSRQALYDLFSSDRQMQFFQNLRWFTLLFVILRFVALILETFFPATLVSVVVIFDECSILAGWLFLAALLLSKGKGSKIEVDMWHGNEETEQLRRERRREREERRRARRLEGYQVDTDVNTRNMENGDQLFVMNNNLAQTQPNSDSENQTPSHPRRDRQRDTTPNNLHGQADEYPTRRLRDRPTDVDATHVDLTHQPTQRQHRRRQPENTAAEVEGQQRRRKKSRRSRVFFGYEQNGFYLRKRRKTREQEANGESESTGLNSLSLHDEALEAAVQYEVSRQHQNHTHETRRAERLVRIRQLRQQRLMFERRLHRLTDETQISMTRAIVVALRRLENEMAVAMVLEDEILVIVESEQGDERPLDVKNVLTTSMPPSILIELPDGSFLAASASQ